MGGTLEQQKRKHYIDIWERHPELTNHHKFYEFTKDEMQTDVWRKQSFLHKHYPSEFMTKAAIHDHPYIPWPNLFQGTTQSLLHFTMFWTSLESFATQE
jgi:hypothetical protein